MEDFVNEHNCIQEADLYERDDHDRSIHIDFPARVLRLHCNGVVICPSFNPLTI